MSPVAPRSVGLAVAVAASVAAAAGIVVGALLTPITRRPAPVRSREFGIHKVPARPRLWDSHPATGPIIAVPDLRDVAPVPPENNHAPATPPAGIPAQRG